jgi:hypothetical protein
VNLSSPTSQRQSALKNRLHEKLRRERALVAEPDAEANVRFIVE